MHAFLLGGFHAGLRSREDVKIRFLLARLLSRVSPVLSQALWPGAYRVSPDYAVGNTSELDLSRRTHD